MLIDFGLVDGCVVVFIGDWLDLVWLRILWFCGWLALLSVVWLLVGCGITFGRFAVNGCGAGFGFVIIGGWCWAY